MLTVGLYPRRGRPQLGDSELFLAAGPSACLYHREREVDFPLSWKVSRLLPEAQEEGLVSGVLCPNGDPIASFSGCLRCRDPCSTLGSESQDAVKV